MIFPWGVGQVSERVGIRFGMIVPGLGALCIVVLTVAVLLGDRKWMTLPDAG
jgi:hypothetical protein